jgi:hypothetical protein
MLYHVKTASRERQPELFGHTVPIDMKLRRQPTAIVLRIVASSFVVKVVEISSS